MSTSDWSIFVRDSNGNRVGEVDVYKSLQIQYNFNDVSTFVIEMPRKHRMAQDLITPGAGVVIYRKGKIFFSGLVLKQEQKYAKTEDSLTISGVDDTAWLVRRLAIPDPVTGVWGVSFDVRTGVASTVMSQFVDLNLGPGALWSREVGITLATDPAIGPTVTKTGSWQYLITLLQEIAITAEESGARIGFRIIEVEGVGRQFQIYTGSDKTGSVIFSNDRGNLSEFSYEAEAPKATFEFVGGSGEGPTRTVIAAENSELMAAWGRIEGEFVDASNSGTGTELSQAATVALAENAGSSKLTLVPIDTADTTFVEDYNLGDKVTAVIPPLGIPAEITVASGTATTTGATDYLQMIDSEGVAFSVGMRVRIKNGGSLKEPGDRTVIDKVSSGGTTKVYFAPVAQAATVAGDVLEGFIPSNSEGIVVQEVIRSVEVTVDDNGEKIRPSISNAATSRFNLFANQKLLAKRIRELGRR